jgi:hypothetical protein
MPRLHLVRRRVGGEIHWYAREVSRVSDPETGARLRAVAHGAKSRPRPTRDKGKR